MLAVSIYVDVFLILLDWLLAYALMLGRCVLRLILKNIYAKYFSHERNNINLAKPALDFEERLLNLLGISIFNYRDQK